MSNVQRPSPKYATAIKEGFLTGNGLLSSGVIIAPAVIAATDFMTALCLAIVFTLVTFVTVALCSFVPKSLVYTVRIIVYTLVASLIYVPVSILLKSVMPEALTAVGIYAPLLITNSFITSKTELKFYRYERKYMLVLLAFYVLGYDVALMLFGTMRGILINGSFVGIELLKYPMTSLSTAFGGFIFLAVSSALYRGIIRYAVRKGDEKK